MKRFKLNGIVDALAFALGAFLISTGFILRFALPPGSGGMEGRGSGWRAMEKPVLYLWGYTRHEWGDIHFWIAVALMALLSLHLFLHWAWIVAVVRGTPREGSGRRVALGLMALLGLVALSVAPFLTPVQTVTRAEQKAMQAER